MAASVYILQSERNPERYYTGLTTDVAARLTHHNGSHSPHTSDGCPWRLVVSIQFADQQRAAEFEKYLKSGSGRAFTTRHFR